MSDSQEQEEVPLLAYKNGYWTGKDGAVYLEFPNALFMKHYKAELLEQEIPEYTEKDAGRRAEIFRQCRRPSYWRGVTDPNLIRTPIELRESEGKQADNSLD